MPLPRSLVSFREYHPESQGYFFFILASVTVFSVDVIHTEQHMTLQFYGHLSIFCCMPGAYFVLINLILVIIIGVTLCIILS